MKKLVLFGASSPEILRVLRKMKIETPELEILGFLDNDKAKHGKMFFDAYPVLGGSEKTAELAKDPDVRFVNLIGRTTRLRYEITKSIVDAGGKLGNVIYPGTDLFMARVGPGAYITERVAIQAGVTVGDNCSIHVNTVVGHEGTVGSSVFIAPGVNISGCVTIEDGVLIGANATIFPRLTIGKWATIGAGAVVTEDVPPYAVVFGNPARAVFQNDVPYPHASVLAA